MTKKLQKNNNIQVSAIGLALLAVCAQAHNDRGELTATNGYCQLVLNATKQLSCQQHWQHGWNLMAERVKSLDCPLTYGDGSMFFQKHECPTGPDQRTDCFLEMANGASSALAYFSTQLCAEESGLSAGQAAGITFAVCFVFAVMGALGYYKRDALRDLLKGKQSQSAAKEPLQDYQSQGLGL